MTFSISKSLLSVFDNSLKLVRFILLNSCYLLIFWKLGIFITCCVDSTQNFLNRCLNCRLQHSCLYISLWLIYIFLMGRSTATIPGTKVYLMSPAMKSIVNIYLFIYFFHGKQDFISGEVHFRFDINTLLLLQVPNFLIRTRSYTLISYRILLCHEKNLCLHYLKRISFRVDLISRGQKNRISRGFNFANQLLLKFLRGFNFAN